MILPDVNVLLYAHKRDLERHDEYREWLRALLTSRSAFALSDLVLCGVIRIATHPRVFDPPSTMGEVLDFVTRIRERPNRVSVSPGPRHWDIFLSLCRSGGVKGNLVPDAYLAALAIESGSELATTDRDFARFPELRWRHPLEGR